MREVLFTEIPAGLELMELPSLADRSGSHRLKLAAGILGEKGAWQAAEKAGPYQLSDELCEQLRMNGAALPSDGEVRALSPNRWRQVQLPGEMEVAGILLSEAKQKAFLAFLNGRQLQACETLRLAEHFFYEEPLKVLVRYTAPRFKPS